MTVRTKGIVTCSAALVVLLLCVWVAYLRGYSKGVHRERDLASQEDASLGLLLAQDLGSVDSVFIETISKRPTPPRASAVIYAMHHIHQGADRAILGNAEYDALVNELVNEVQQEKHGGQPPERDNAPAAH